jgi:hypothetical protein
MNKNVGRARLKPIILDNLLNPVCKSLPAFLLVQKYILRKCMNLSSLMMHTPSGVELDAKNAFFVLKARRLLLLFLGLSDHFWTPRHYFMTMRFTSFWHGATRICTSNCDSRLATRGWCSINYHTLSGVDMPFRGSPMSGTAKSRWDRWEHLVGKRPGNLVNKERLVGL